MYQSASIQSHRAAYNAYPQIPATRYPAQAYLGGNANAYDPALSYCSFYHHTLYLVYSFSWIQSLRTCVDAVHN